MRQVSVSRRVWQVGEGTTQYYIKGQLTRGTWIDESFNAIFHDFTLDTDTSQSEVQTYPVAILELADGSVQIVHAEHVTFLNPTKFEEVKD